MRRITTIVALAVVLSANLALGQSIQKLKPLAQTGEYYPQERFSAAWCALAECHFVVKVDANCVISLDPQWMGVQRKKVATLIWHLAAPSGFTFATDGSVPFKPESAPGGNEEFGKEDLRKDNTIVQRLDKNTKAGTYHYKIRIFKDGRLCGEVDPPVINEM
jgi:hypothetical protein